MVCGGQIKWWRDPPADVGNQNEEMAPRDEKGAPYPTALARPRRLVSVRHAVHTVWRATVGPMTRPIETNVVLLQKQSRRQSAMGPGQENAHSLLNQTKKALCTPQPRYWFP
jgi:hypothetical protein